MFKSYSLNIALCLAFSLTPSMYADENESTDDTQIEAIEEAYPKLIEWMITAGFMVRCKRHNIDETEQDVDLRGRMTHFTSTLEGNGTRFSDRILRLLGLVEPTITIESTTTLHPVYHFEEEFEKVLFDYAGNHAPFCTETKNEDTNTKTVSCSIVHTMKEYYDLKAKFETAPDEE